MKKFSIDKKIFRYIAIKKYFEKVYFDSKIILIEHFFFVANFFFDSKQFVDINNFFSVFLSIF